MNPIREYFDAWSGIYDAELRADPGEDVAFYRRRARRADGPVLEVGCGTGRIYLELLADGVDAVGIDVSAAMLDRLREKARRRGLVPAVERADMADFELERQFSLVLLPSATFCYNLSIEAQLATLANVGSVLADEGRLILSYYAPDFDTICERYGTDLETDLTVDGAPCTLRSRISFEDEVERIVRVEKSLRNADGAVIEDATCFEKLLPKREMELLLRRAGFDDYRVYGGFDGRALTAERSHVVWVVDAPRDREQ